MISVIIPVYNVQDTLERAVESVQNQTYQNIEVILVNDGSTDSSGQICDELAATDERIRVIHKPNGGLSSARNAGIEAAKGEFLSFLDSDDYFDANLYKEFSRDLKENPHLELYIFNVVRVNGAKEEVQEAVRSVSRDKEHNVSLLFDFSGLNFYAWNKIYAKHLFEKVRFPEGKLYEDTMPSYETTSLAKEVVTSAFPGIYYIQNEGSIVASSFNPKQYDNVTERMRLLQAVQNDFPALEGKALERLLDGFLSTGYKIATSKKTEETIKYYQILKEDSKKIQPFFRQHKEVSSLKQAALQLLNINQYLYKNLYKFYLGK